MAPNDPNQTGSNVTSMVTLPVFISEPMKTLQRIAEMMEYSHLLDTADECDDPYMQLDYVVSWFISIYYAYERPWKPFNPILGETYKLVNNDGITFIAEQVSHHPPVSAGHAENEHFSYDVNSKAWRVAEAPKDDKFQYTYFGHRINSLETVAFRLSVTPRSIRAREGGP